MNVARSVLVGLLAMASCISSITHDDEPRKYGSWTTGIALPEDRFEGYAATDGEAVFMLGGIVGQNDDFSTAMPSTHVDVLRRGAKAWVSGPPLPVASAKHHLTVAVVDRNVFVLGGFDGILGGMTPGGAFVPRESTFVLRGGSWMRLRDQPIARGGATAQAIGRKIYVVGGASTEGVLPYRQHFAYDVDTDTWEEKRALPTAREHLASCVLGGKMLVVGGWVGPDNVASTAAELYDPSSDAWETVPPLPTRRGGLGAVTRSGVCHVIAGEDWKIGLPGTVDTHEIFDPLTRTWTSAAPLPVARHGIGTVLFDDAIFVVGGGPIRGNSYTNRVDVFHM